MNATPLEIERAFLRHAAADTSWPEVTYGDRQIRGEPGWLSVIARASPNERRDLLARLGPHLLTLGEGARRLQAWPDIAPSAHPIARLDRRGLRHVIAYYGDVELLAIVLDGLMIAPPIVRVAVVEEAVIEGVGWSTLAWTSGIHFASPDEGAPRRRRINLCGASRDAEAIRRAFLHECGHVWAHAPADPELDVCPLATGVEAVHALAAEEGWEALARPERERVERLADTLAAAWLCAAEPEL
jgi:hypothetical protein